MSSDKELSKISKQLDEMESDAPPITADQIIDASKQWSLEGDCTLLKWMNQISKNLEGRVLKTTSALSLLTTTVDRASVSLSNATNNLAALQYSQFVENRVHDDDETLANVSEVPNPQVDETDKAKEFDVASFVKTTVEKMNSCHEAVTISYEDSDEEEPSTNVVYRAKNPYDARPLPHLYGSDKWKEKWHIGLCDSDDDFSADEDSEQFSDSSSTTDNSFESTNQTMSEWDSTAWGLNTNLVGERKETHTPSNDGESSNQGEKCSQKSGSSTPRVQRARSSTEPVEEQRYYQHVPRRQEDVFDDLFTESQRQATAIPNATIPQDQSVNHPIISDEPPPDIQSDEITSSQRTGAKKTLNLFDDDEFSSFMHQIVKSATSRNAMDDDQRIESTTKERHPQKRVIPHLPSQRPHGGSVPHDLFDEHTSRLEPAKRTVAPNLFTETSEEPAPSKRTVASNLFDELTENNRKKEPSKKIIVPNLFDDSGEEPELEKEVEPLKKLKLPNLFEDTDELFNPNPRPLVQTKHKVPSPTPQDDLFAASPPLSTTVGRQTRNLFDDDEEDDDFEKIFATKQSGNETFTQKTKDLFKDDAAENVVSETARHAPVSPGKDSRKTALTTKGLFDEEDNDHVKDEDNLFPSTVVKKDLFAGRFDEKQADETVSKKSPSPETPKGPIKGADQTIPSTSNAAKEKTLFADIFQNEPPDDIAVSPTDKKLTKVADIFADDFKDDFEEIIPKKLPQAKKRSSLTPENEKSTSEAAKVDNNLQEKKDENNGSTLSCMISLHESETDPQLDQRPETPTYTNLFHDKPPSDVDEDAGHQPTTFPTAYGNINLFADVPPDDDFPTRVPPVETKRIHSIFYDDFSETIEASREKRAPASSYIFNEEPPPDDETQGEKQHPEAKVSMVEHKKDKPTVSKLKKTDLQINVEALLPSSKAPSFRKPEPVSDETPVTVSKVSDVPQPSNRDVPENILPNLNRDRIKVQVKRRPSTRRGRQESYRRSLIEEEVQTIIQSSNDSQKDDEAAVEEEPLIPKKEVFQSKTILSPISELKAALKSPVPLAKPTTKSALFEESDSDEDGIFKSLSSKKTQDIKTVPVSNNVDSLFDSGLANTDNTSNRSANQFVGGKAQVQGITESETNVVEVVMPTEESLQPTRSTSLFGESDDDSDDLFKELKASKKPEPSKPVVEKQVPAKPVVTQPVVKPVTSLFSSDEDDGPGDIFGKPKTKTRAQPKKVDSVTTKPTSSLFADLSDDDDLFRNARKKPTEGKPNSKPSSVAVYPAKPPNPNQQQPAASNNPLADLLDP